MRIIVIGAGEVGYHIAERLSHEAHEIVVIERHPEVVRRVENAASCAFNASISVASSIDGNSSARLATMAEIVCASSGVSRPAPTSAGRRLKLSNTFHSNRAFTLTHKSKGWAADVLDGVPCSTSAGRRLKLSNTFHSNRAFTLTHKSKGWAADVLDGVPCSTSAGGSWSSGRIPSGTVFVNEWRTCGFRTASAP